MPTSPPPAAQAILHWTDLAVRLALALAAGFAVTLIYRGTRKKWEVNPTFPPTLVMLSILIAAVSQVIGENVALAFSLVGALSIVRFRTVVRDTQDTAFVIFAVVVGMATGTGNFIIAAITLAIGGIAAIWMAQSKTGTSLPDEYALSLRAGLGADVNVLLAPLLAKHADFSRNESVLTGKQGATLDYTFRLRLKNESQPAEVVKDFNRVEGIQNVELRRITDDL